MSLSDQSESGGRHFAATSNPVAAEGDCREDRNAQEAEAALRQLHTDRQLQIERHQHRHRIKLGLLVVGTLVLAGWLYFGRQ